MQETQTVDLDVQTLSLVFEHIDIAAVIVSISREIVAINKAAEVLFGYENSEVVNQSTRMLYATDVEYTLQGQQRYYERSRLLNDVYNTEYKRKSGKVFTGQTSAGAIKNNAGEALFFIALIKDDSARTAAEEALNQLHSITSSRELDFEQRVSAILRLGAEHFELPIGIFSKIEGNEYEIKQAIHPDNQLEIGMRFDLDLTYCWHVFHSNKVEGFHHVAQSEIRHHPCYKAFQLEAYIGAPIFVDGKPYGTLNFSSPTPVRPFINQDYELIRLFSEWVGHEIARNNDFQELELAHKTMEKMANTDFLTGLANRACSEKALAHYIELNQKKNTALSVAILDFDYFKSINDKYGHPVGDEVLKLFAQGVNALDAEDCHYGRWGGEEFIAIYVNHSVEQASHQLEALRHYIVSHPVFHNELAVSATVSGGLTQYQSGECSDSILNRADALLYKAKRDGRNRIEIG
ncbi:diguanylate cyclase [Vibrio rumoiensis]|uniref:sensor domain-containing diguanylate cyclase n=1 Tax=Vibrio rumoiensis TaxID=76258 RepID=UPI003AA90374